MGEDKPDNRITSEADLDELVSKLEELYDKMNFEREIKEIQDKNEKLCHSISELEHIADVLVRYHYDEKVINFLNKNGELNKLANIENSDLDKLNDDGKCEVYVEGIFTSIKNAFLAIVRFIKSLLDKLVKFFKRMFSSNREKKIRKEAKELNTKVKKKKEYDEKVAKNKEKSTTKPGEPSKKSEFEVVKDPLERLLLRNAPEKKSIEGQVKFISVLISRLSSFFSTLVGENEPKNFDFSEVKSITEEVARSTGLSQQFAFDSDNRFVIEPVVTKSIKFVDSDYYRPDTKSHVWFENIVEDSLSGKSNINTLIDNIKLFCDYISDEINNLGDGDKEKSELLKDKLNKYSTLILFIVQLGNQLERCSNINYSTLLSIKTFINKNT